MIPGDPILDWLNDYAVNNRPVRLINTYRGIPIAYSARVITVGPGNAVFAVNEYQAVCLALDGKTHILLSESPEVLFARVISVDVHQKEVTSRNLGKLAIRWAIVCARVQPSEPIDAEIRVEKYLFPCRLVDISLNGVGAITLGSYIYGDLGIEKGSKIQFYFTLPPTHSPVQLAGQVTSVVVAEDTNQRRIGCKTFPQSNIDLLLLEYVALRRDELMRELSMVYATMRREQLKSVVSR